MNTFIFAILGIAILLLIFLLISIYVDKKTGKDILDMSKTWKIFWLLFSLIVITGFVLDITSYKSEYTHTKTATEHIVALNDNPGIKSNRYYARRTYIESTLYYNYMVKLPDSYIANQIPAKSARIYETDNNYRVEWWKKEKGYLFAKTSKKYWKLYIPQNSIVSEYEIDLQ